MAGDLFIVVHIDGKQGIQRNGLNLYSKIDVDYTEAILGSVIKVGYIRHAKNFWHLSFHILLFCNDLPLK